MLKFNHRAVVNKTPKNVTTLRFYDSKLSMCYKVPKEVVISKYLSITDYNEMKLMIIWLLNSFDQKLYREIFQNNN